VAGPEVVDDIVSLLLEVRHWAMFEGFKRGESIFGGRRSLTGGGGVGRFVEVGDDGVEGRGWHARGFLLCYGTIGAVLALNVEQVSTSWQVDGGGHGLLAAVFYDIPLAEADGGVLVTVG